MLHLNQEVKTLLEARLKDKQISQNELAKNLSISGATLSNILNEKWENITDGMFLNLRSKLNPGNWQLVETRNLKEVYKMCDLSRTEKMFIAIKGSEGLGKTISLSTYYTSNPHTYMITCDKGMNPKQLFSQLAKEMGLPSQLPVYELKKQIIASLNQQFSPLIIIDEISKVALPNLTHFQDLWDGIKENAGLIISGAPHFFDKFLQSVNNRKIGMPELYSRIAYHCELKRPTQKEIEAICQANGLLDSESLGSAKTAGNYRILSHYINNKKNGLI